MESVVSQEGIFDTGVISCRYLPKKPWSALSFNSETRKEFSLGKEGRERWPKTAEGRPWELWRCRSSEVQPFPNTSEWNWKVSTPVWDLISVLDPPGVGKGVLLFLTWDFETLLQILQSLTKGRENSSRRGKTSAYSQALQKQSRNFGLLGDCVFMLLLFCSLSLLGVKIPGILGFFLLCCSLIRGPWLRSRWWAGPRRDAKVLRGFDGFANLLSLQWFYLLSFFPSPPNTRWWITQAPTRTSRLRWRKGGTSSTAPTDPLHPWKTSWITWRDKSFAQTTSASPWRGAASPDPEVAWPCRALLLQGNKLHEQEAFLGCF